MSLMVSISGIRGIVGKSLTPDILIKNAAAFAQYCNGGEIVIGRDGRTTGKIIGNIVSSTLLSMGCDVIALGIAPTPTIALAVNKLGAAGGIAITASHNPMQWNGLKFISNRGMFLNAEQNKKLWCIVDRNRFNYVSWEKTGEFRANNDFIKKHVEAILNLPYISINQIIRRKIKVVVDCVNAAGGVVIPGLLRALGCRVVELNCEASGVFTRNPEPVPENILKICRIVKNEKADIGIVVDPDVDRLALVTEKGEPFGEEYTIASAVKFVLTKKIKSKNPRKIVVNLSTTRAVDDIAKSFNATVFRTPVGEINVAEKMKTIGAVIGGEGNGGVILPDVHYCRDALVGIVLILQQLAEFDGPLSDLKLTMPSYSMVKSKINIKRKDPDSLLEKFRIGFKDKGNIDLSDGVKIDFRDSWIHLRKSNTEPVIRIISEARTENQALKLTNSVKKYIN